MKINWEEDWWLFAIPIAAVVGIAASRQRQKSLKKKVPTKFVPQYVLPKKRGAPFAQAPNSVVWPIPNSNNPRRFEVAYRDVNGKNHGNGARAFRASRGERHHGGIDLYADAGDIVVAPESGTLVAQQNFLNTIPGKDAILIQGDSGNVILLGEIVAKSFEDFGLSMGSRVKAGQPVAKVGLTSNGSHMLHFETYTQGATKNARWYKGQEAPSTLRDPSDYLLKARQLSTRAA